MVVKCIACEISAWQSGFTAQLSLAAGLASASVLALAAASAAGKDRPPCCCGRASLPCACVPCLPAPAPPVQARPGLAGAPCGV